MKQFFAIGVGGTGAKCLEALTHLHACGLLNENKTSPSRLGVFLVEPDEQSALKARAQTAITRYAAMQQAIGRRADLFAKSELKDYGAWNPLGSASSRKSLNGIFSKDVLKTQAPGVASLFDCLFPPEEQSVDLEVGFRGRPPIGSAVMSRVNLEKEAQSGQWQQMLSDIQTAAGSGDTTVIHLFGSVFGGTGASGVPTLGQLLKNWLRDQGINRVQVQASLLLPYFDFEGVANDDTGVHAESRNFQLNTDAALQYLSTSGETCFDRVFLIGSDIKARYDFSIGGVSQTNAANLVELLSVLGIRHSPQDGAGYAHVLSRAHQEKISWEDLPNDEIVGEAMARGARFAVAWRNNFSREIDDAQKISIRGFLAGAPWARRFFDPSGKATGRDGRPNIRDKEQLSVQSSINEYIDTLLQWLNQITTNLGSGFKQELFTASLLYPANEFMNDLHKIVLGKARPTGDESADTVEAVKFKIDQLPDDAITHTGMAGLADCLWQQVS
jgi:hypothetical protein